MILSAKDALVLARNRDKLPKKVFVTLTGTVTAQSEIIRMKPGYLFIIEVEQKLTILVKECVSTWFQGIIPTKSYVFKDLRLTTLKKGVASPCPVFAVQGVSSFCEADSVEKFDTVSLEEWLQGTCPGQQVSFDDQICSDEPEHLAADLVSYQGRISSVHDAKYGIYGLDDKIKLVLYTITNRHIGCELVLNDEVTIYNAHLIKERHQITLVCCVKSCIKINSLSSGSSHSDQETSRKDPMKEDKSTKSYDLTVFSLNLKETDTVAQLKKELSRKGRCTDSQDKIISCFLRSDLCPGVQEDRFTPLDIFIQQHDVACPFLPSKKDLYRLPEILELASEVEKISTQRKYLAPEESSSKKSSHLRDTASVSRVHSYEENEVFFGSISGSASGPALFSDGHKSLPVVLLLQNVLRDTQSAVKDLSTDSWNQVNIEGHLGKIHTCSHRCYLSLEPKNMIRCPILSSGIAGKLICVKNCILVVEEPGGTFVNPAHARGQEGKPSSFVYIAFCLLDCALVEKMSENIAEKKWLPLQSKEAALSEWLFEEENSVSCVLYVSKKLPLVVDEERKGNREQFVFKLEGCLFKPVTGKRKLEASSDKKVALSAQRSVTFCLSKKASRWHSFISSGEMYRLSAPKSQNGNCADFQSTFLSKEHEKGMRMHNVTLEIAVSSAVNLVRINPGSWHLDKSVMKFPEFATVSQVQVGFPQSVVSFLGVIIKKEYIDPGFQDFNGPVIKNVKLEIVGIDLRCDGTSGDASPLSIYVDGWRKPYIVGLVPGAVVEFIHLQRKVSKKTGNAYCRFQDVSTFKVITMLDTPIIERILSSLEHSWEDCFDTASRELLINLWTGDVQDKKAGQEWLIQCHIGFVFKLSIKCVCRRCKGVFHSGMCQSRGCGNVSMSEIVANASVLVDDGSCQACVKLWSVDHVRQLLTLTESQWSDVVAGVEAQGEILLTNNNQWSCLSAIEHFLCQLVRSLLVLRPCLMVVKRSEHSPNAASVNAMPVQDFQKKEVKIGYGSCMTLTSPLQFVNCVGIRDIC
ncbi:uncharacterized protein LOC101847156 [Aplysia californica]|uniref:CST complex subunit CTC1 n=1 Tax=Aplysia californica TaxID=6500 RepID=A0ABM0JA35_APLCA|nr:uncharacterized protein LOC101847156 [Aplysia californica]